MRHLIGRYIDGLGYSPNRENAIYPSFISNKDSVYYYSIFEDVDAKGCLKLSGNRMIIFGRQQQDIQLVFYDNDQAFVEATAKRFKIQESSIFSEKSKVKIIWNNDSIVHPQLKLFYNDINIPGTQTFNPELEKAGRLGDFLELGQLMALDALDRNESCGGHFREEYQTEENEAKRNDDDYAYVSAWEYNKNINKSQLHKENLDFKEVKLTSRSYK